MTAARPRAVRALSALRDGRSARRGRFWSRNVRADRRLPATELTGYALPINQTPTTLTIQAPNANVVSYDLRGAL